MEAGSFVSFHVGLDLGRENDFTAAAILEKQTPHDRYSRVCGGPSYSLIGLKRFALRTPYTTVVREVARRLASPPFTFTDALGRFDPQRQTPLYLAFDETGTGAPVADLLHENAFLSNRATLVGITITAGRDVTERDFGYNVPKRDLILQIQVELQRENLQIASNLPEAANLVEELQNFEMKITSKANDVYSAKNGAHDDLVLAVGLALWNARNTEDDVNESEAMSMLLNWTGKGY